MRLLAALPFVLLLLSCSHSPKTKEPDAVPVKTLVHPLFFQEEVASRINFPFWFDRSQASAHRIWKITIYTYRTGDDDELLYSRTFTFGRNGELTHIRRIEFMDDIAISDKRYAYFGETAGLFHPVVIITDSSGMNKSNTYRLLKPVSFRKDLSDYREIVDQTHIYFLPNPKKQGALSVDSIAHPTPKDWVILGTPEKPQKRYRVSNTVTESEVTTYTYRKDGFPEIIQWNDFPFRQKRYFHYVNGVFTGFTDYSLIDNSTVSKTTTAILYRDGLPQTVIRYRTSESGREILMKEQFEYTFYTNQ